MDDGVRNFLTKCNLQDYVPVFQKHEIDFNRLMNLPESMISELFDKLYPRHIFTEQLQRLKDNAELSLKVNPTRRSVLTMCPSNSVELLLKQTALGRVLLDKAHVGLDKTNRRNLTEIIIDHYVNQGMSLGLDDFMILAKEIKQIFPKEDEATYFLPFKPNAVRKMSSGKLYDKYYNLRRVLKRQLNGPPPKQPAQMTESLPIPAIEITNHYRTPVEPRNDGIRRCVFPNCHNVEEPTTNGHRSSITLFNFPKNEHTKKRWANICRIVEVSENDVVCSDHFVDEDYDKDTYNHKVLKKKALPMHVVSKRTRDEPDPGPITGNFNKIQKTTSEPMENISTFPDIPEYSTDTNSCTNTMTPFDVDPTVCGSSTLHEDDAEIFNEISSNFHIVETPEVIPSHSSQEIEFLKTSLEMEREVNQNLQHQVQVYQKYINVLQNRIKGLERPSTSTIRHGRNECSSVQNDQQIRHHDVYIKQEEPFLYDDEL